MDVRGPLCVGLDPHPELLAAWGLPVDVTGLQRFCAIVVEALGERVAVLKPQSAFFERFGSAGIAVLEWTLTAIRESGAVGLLDVKRGDVGSTMAAYASAYLDPASPLAADAITVSPYLGFGSLQPVLDLAAAHDRGIFVLALTSNPEGAHVQHARTAAGPSIAQAILDEVAARNAGAAPMGSLGVVVGATVGETGHAFGGLNGPILAPGLGAQGGTPEDLRRLFGSALPDVLASTSREVLGHGPRVQSLREEADRLNDQLHEQVAALPVQPSLARFGTSSQSAGPCPPIS
ncbi:MAG: orotidine-5'-phosphate decarboxylase [Geodermatophilaceae bacterium]|nr:orotidine-5'-phosphate decarboxylase [Geodermatophilaceae bacterium]